MRAKEHLSPSLQLWVQDIALWLRVQQCNQYANTGILADCSQTEINSTETQVILQNAVVKGLGGCWRHPDHTAL